jgi:4-amino-4-deoxy-L-arabinose transferase-like glycosyltransferase
MQSWARNPLVWILALAAGLRLAGLFWGLPASDGWDDDGFAPRNFLTALALTYKPGAYFTYPPLHAIFLALLTWPGIVLALLQAPSLHQADVIAAVTKPGLMTFFAVTARLVNLAMSLGIIWGVGEMARLSAGRRAGLFAAGACALNFGLTYYGQVSNLDVPYLFWGTLSLLYFMRAAVEQQPRRFWPAMLCAAAAVATKDQAYALFLISVPIFLFLWWRSNPPGLVFLRSLFAASAVALFLLLLVDGAITNPGGFVQRLHFLVGSASGDYATYPRSWDGLLALLRDMAAWFGQGYGVPATLLALLGLILQMKGGADRGSRIAGLLPVLATLSFFLCFNLAALRSDARFLMPLAVLACVYIGIAASWLIVRANHWAKLAGSVVVVCIALLALHQCLAISAAMLQDPRYDAEAWMRAQVRPGDVIETYGQNAYLPRFPQSAHVLRVGAKPSKARAPLYGVTEVQEPFGNPRAAHFIVVNDWWLRHYTKSQSELGGHRTASRAQAALYDDISARDYFRALSEGRLAYRLVHIASPAPGIWPQVHIHESLNETILIFERTS